MPIDFIKPSELPVASSVNTSAAIVVENGATVEKATPAQVVDAGRPIATEAQALAGLNNTTAMTPLTTKQALDNYPRPFLPLAGGTMTGVLAFSRAAQAMASFRNTTNLNANPTILRETNAGDFGIVHGGNNTLALTVEPAGTTITEDEAAVTKEKGDARYMRTSNYLDVDRTFATVADMVASDKNTVGDYVRTLGYYAAGDGGGNDYEIVAAATGTVDGGSYINLSGITGQAKGLFANEYRAAQFGVTSTGDMSVKLAAMNAAAVAAKADTLDPVKIILEGTIQISEPITLGGAGENYVIDTTNALIEVIAGGDLEANSDQAAVTIQASTSNIFLGTISADHYCGGYMFDGCLKSQIFGGRVERFTYRGYDTTGNNADMQHYSPSGNEWDISEPEYDISTSYVSDGYYANCNDMVIHGANLGYCGRPIVYGPDAGQTFFVSAHPYNGNLHAPDDPGVDPRDHPNCVTNLCTGNVYLIAPYIDNGYVDDQTGSLTIQGGRHYVANNRVTMTHPFTRVKMQVDPTNMDGTIQDFDSSVGFYSGSFTNDFSNAVTDMVYTPSQMRDDGRRARVSKVETRLITDHGVNWDNYTIKQGDGTASIVERYKAGTSAEVNVEYRAGTVTITGASTTGEVLVASDVESGMKGSGDTLELYAGDTLVAVVKPNGNIRPGTDGGGNMGETSFRWEKVFANSAVLSLTDAPSSAADTGVAGEVRVDGSYIYVCTATDTWKRVAIATW